MGKREVWKWVEFRHCLRLGLYRDRPLRMNTWPSLRVSATAFFYSVCKLPYITRHSMSVMDESGNLQIETLSEGEVIRISLLQHLVAAVIT